MSAFPAAPCLPPRQISRIYLEEFKRTYSGVWRASARWPTLEQLFFIRVLGGPHRSAALPTSLGVGRASRGAGEGAEARRKNNRWAWTPFHGAIEKALLATCSGRLL